MIIIVGIIVCLIVLIVCAICFKLETDRIINDYEFKNKELSKRLRQWSEHSYEQNDEIKELKRRLKRYEQI